MIYKIISSAILCASANLLLGNTISITSFSDEPLVGDDSSCTVFGAPPIACYIHPTYSDATGRHISHVEANASAGLDSLSASMFASSDDASIFATYAVSFSDSLTVLGGSGPGTLIAHFHLISENAQFRTPGYAPSPSYNFQLGQAGLGFTANLPTDPPNPDNGGREVDDIDVSSPFVFGQPLPLAAGAFAHESPRSDRGTFVGVRSSVVVSGYTVLNPDGTTVMNAVVIGNAVPEPATWVLALGAFWALALLRRNAFR